MGRFSTRGLSGFVSAAGMSVFPLMGRAEPLQVWLLACLAYLGWFGTSSIPPRAPRAAGLDAHVWSHKMHNHNWKSLQPKIGQHRKKSGVTNS